MCEVSKHNKIRAQVRFAQRLVFWLSMAFCVLVLASTCGYAHADEYPAPYGAPVPFTLDEGTEVTPSLICTVVLYDVVTQIPDLTDQDYPAAKEAFDMCLIKIGATI